MSLEEHFFLLGTDADPPEENLLVTALGVIGYSAQSLAMGTVPVPKLTKHMRSEYVRLKNKVER